jgi:hypothetical protein
MVRVMLFPMIKVLFFLTGVRDNAVGWGTTLQVGRSRVWFPVGPSRFFYLFNPCGRTVARESTRPVAEMSTRHLPLEAKTAGAERRQPCLLHVPIVWKSWEPEAPGADLFVYGIALPLPLPSHQYCPKYVCSVQYGCFLWFTWFRAFPVCWSGIFWTIFRWFQLPLLLLVSVLFLHSTRAVFWL